MSDSPKIIEYARTAVAGEIQVRREGEWLTVIIPSPRLWRLLLTAAIRAAVYSLLVLAFISICMVVFERNGPFDPHDLKSGLVCFVLPVSVILMLFQLIRAAMSGDRPTIIQASAAILQLAPRGFWGRQRTWQPTELVDIGVREGGAFTVIARQINLRIIQQSDRFETLCIPWNGNGALASIEDNLRDVLSLPRMSHPPLNPPT